MPIFEYRCQICEHEFEELIRGSSDETEVKCPECSSHEVEKKLSVFGFSSGGSSGPSTDSSACRTCVGRSCATCR